MFMLSLHLVSGLSSIRKAVKGQKAGASNISSEWTSQLQELRCLSLRKGSEEAASAQPAKGTTRRPCGSRSLQLPSGRRWAEHRRKTREVTNRMPARLSSRTGGACLPCYVLRKTYSHSSRSSRTSATWRRWTRPRAASYLLSFVMLHISTVTVQDEASQQAGHKM